MRIHKVPTTVGMIAAALISLGEVRPVTAQTSILLRLENPKISWIDDAKVVGDGIAIDTPVFRHFIA